MTYGLLKPMCSVILSPTLRSAIDFGGKCTVSAMPPASTPTLPVAASTEVTVAGILCMLPFILCIILLCILPLCMEPMLLDDDTGVIAPDSCAYTEVAAMQRPSAIDATMIFGEKFMMILHLAGNRTLRPDRLHLRNRASVPPPRCRNGASRAVIRALSHGPPHGANRLPVYTDSSRPS